MTFNYDDVEQTNKKRCPNFTGVKEHGNRMTLFIDSETADEIANKFSGCNPYSDSTTVCIYEDGTINMLVSYYNDYLEDWAEKEDLVFVGVGKDTITEAIDNCLKYEPIANNSGLMLKSVAEVVQYLKEGKF